MTYYSYHSYYNYSHSSSTQEYEFTAFTESDLVDGNLGCGDTFVMPEYATICITVTDDDKELSGDYCDNATDSSKQTASITEGGEEIGNGGQIYAESAYWVKGSDGCWYVLIEIEQEGASGDFFAFAGDVPPAGVELTVHGVCNTGGVDYCDLGSGPKQPETGTICGTVFCDTDCDGEQEITEKKVEIDVIKNCDFEINKGQDYNVCYIDGWSVSGHTGDLLIGPGNGFDGNAADNAIFELDGCSVLTQKFSVEKAGKYCLSLDVYRNHCASDADNDFKIIVNGEAVDVIVVENDGSLTFEIELAAGHNQIDFKSLADSYCRGPAIDNVKIEKFVEVYEEPVKEGVTVKLIDANTGDVVAETTTDANGNYSFEDVPVGDYKVMGVAPDGTEFTIKDATNDDQDSDVDEDGMSDVISITGGEKVDIDLGLCDKPAELGGRYFCDENRNDVDDGNGVNNNEVGVAGAIVTLYMVGMADALATTMTDDNGDYCFTDLKEGEYYVVFQNPDEIAGGNEAGKTFVAQDAGNDDEIDSDADPSTGQTGTYFLPAGGSIKNIDAGIEKVNEDPNATDDSGMGCADELIKVDLSDNYSDTDSASVGITAINGVAITDGGPAVSVEVMTSNGAADVLVTLDNDEFCFDGEDAFAFLDITEEESATFSYTVTDGDGGTAQADIDITFCGDANDIQSLYASYPDSLGNEDCDAEYQIQTSGADGGTPDDNAYALLLANTGDNRFDGVVFEQAYCLNYVESLIPGQTFASAPVHEANILSGDDGSIFNFDQISSVNGETAANNLDLVNWVLNQDYTNDGSGQYNDWEVQRVIWELVNYIDTAYYDGTGIDAYGQNEDVEFIISEALANGEGFVADDGGIATMIIDPCDPASDNKQPFIIAFNFDDYDCIC